MKKILAEICSWFIPGKERRRAFRRRHTKRPLIALQKSLNNDMERIVQRALSTMVMHQRTFVPFKGSASGRDVVIVAGGPSVSKFKPIADAVYIGVNRAYKFKEIDFDYLFWQDYAAVRGRETLEELRDYRKDKCVKFIGLICEDDWKDNLVFPESYALEMGALRYRAVEGSLERFAYDLSVQPLADCGSVVFSALQFALWLNPRKLYLVGCDCSHGGYFYKDGNAENKNSNTLEIDRVVQGYIWFKKFAQRYYPETELVSINPVGLRGIFLDCDQTKEKR